MKIYNIDILSDIDLEMTPLTEDQEGSLHGGFVGIIGSACTNDGCKNVGCTNNECPTATSKPTSTDGNGFTSSIMGLLI